MNHAQENNGAPSPTLVLCVDDNPDITAVMRMVIDSEPTLRCIGALSSADRLVEEVRAMSQQPHVVLLDATMPGKSPLSAMRELSAAFPAIRTIVYSGHDESVYADRAMDAGAWGYVSKSDDPATILLAVRAVAAGHGWWLRAVRPR